MQKKNKGNKGIETTKRILRNLRKEKYKREGRFVCMFDFVREMEKGGKNERNSSQVV
ncbi:MAG: hypothetical protein U9P88_01395 [Patescibacteria group bacterium]|nr:hypothetical protein [Patescibacteria group bacterium]